MTLLTMVAVAVTLAVTCAVGWLALRATIWDISARGSVLIARDLAPLASRDIATSGRLTEVVRGPGTTVVEAVRGDGTVLTTPGEDVHLMLGSAQADAARDGTSSVRNVTASTGETYRVITLTLTTPGWVLVVGRPLTSLYEILHVFGIVVLVVGAVGLGWAWLVGHAVAKTALHPIRRFTRLARHVADTEDLQPVPADARTTTEIAALSTAFNQMLTRLACSREQQDRLIADASHELRTPLTSMRTNLELLTLDARQHRLTETARTQILDDVHAQTAELTALIADLVHLTREKATHAHEPLDLAAVTAAALDRVRRRGPDLTFDVELTSLRLHGDQALLERAVTNLLDNAVKWSPPGTSIHVRVAGRQLLVADEGPGIAEADLPHVFDRFYRAETARSTPGTGLGLAIAAKAAHDHGGTIHADRSPWGGARLTLTLPAAAHDTLPGTSSRCDNTGEPWRVLPDGATISPRGSSAAESRP